MSQADEKLMLAGLSTADIRLEKEEVRGERVWGIDGLTVLGESWVQIPTRNFSDHHLLSQKPDLQPAGSAVIRTHFPLTKEG